MEDRKITLVDLNGNDIQVIMCPPNRNARVALNKIFETEQKEHAKIMRKEKYKPLIEWQAKSNELTEMDAVEMNIGILSAEMVTENEDLGDRLLVERIQAIISKNQSLSEEQWKLINSKYDTIFWGNQDLGELKEALEFFRERFRRR